MVRHCSVRFKCINLLNSPTTLKPVLLSPGYRWESEVQGSKTLLDVDPHDLAPECVFNYYTTLITPKSLFKLL